MGPIRWLLLAPLVLGLCACGGDAPPNKLSAFACTPAELVVSQATAVSCTFDFDDPDLLATSIHAEVTHPTGQVDMVDAPFANPGMLVSGAGYWNASITVASVGTATLAIRFDNDDGSQSNEVSQRFDCVAP